MATMNNDSLIVPMIAYVLEEEATAQERYLQGLDVNVGVELVPCVGADGVRHQRCKESIEVEKEKDSPVSISRVLHERGDY
jgi:hypothetical protein